MGILQDYLVQRFYSKNISDILKSLQASPYALAFSHSGRFIDAIYSELCGFIILSTQADTMRREFLNVQDVSQKHIPIFSFSTK